MAEEEGKKEEKFDFTAMSWGDDEAAQFAEVLSYCKDLKEAWPPNRFVT